MNFSFWPFFLVWFAGATPDRKPQIRNVQIRNLAVLEADAVLREHADILCDLH